MGSPITSLETIPTQELPDVDVELDSETNRETIRLSPDELSRIGAVLGTSDAKVMSCFLAQLQASNLSPDNSEALNIGLRLVRGIRPRDELETMLAIQMVATHDLALRSIRQAKSAEYSPAADSATNRATKLLRTFTAQIEALSRHRGGSHQKVTVEHVNVNEGGRAIVGAVARGEVGGRGG